MQSKTILIATTALAVGVGGTLLIGSMGHDHEEPSAVESTDHTAESHAHGGESDTYYTCPMHPSVVSETPGSCPVCGMDLVEKTRSATGMDPKELAAMGRVALSPTQRVLANVQTAEVIVGGGGTASEIRAVGVVAYDEQGLASIPSWVDGRIEELLVKETGAVVAEGQPVMKIYSEDLLAAQEEYLVSLGSSDSILARQTQKRLELLGMSEEQIARVRKTREAEESVTAFAPNAGTITELKVRQGQYVEEGEPLYDIANLSSVWIEAEVYERNLGAVQQGAPVRVVADAFPDQSMQGTITFVHPVVDNDTRTVKVRVEIADADAHERLKPGMYTSVFFQRGAEAKDVADREILVPKSAVIRGGKTNSVFVEVEPNVFERREVEIGRATDELLAVRSGVKAGEEVAYRGGFLLDSEVQLNSFGGSQSHHGGHEAHEEGGE